MGGGGAMRAAVKAAGIGIQTAAVRGLPPNFNARTSVRPPASSASSASAAIAWELDEWEIAGYEVVEEKPRLVFGPAPSIEESKEAASQLKDALDQLYFSPSKPTTSFHSVSVADELSVVSDADAEPEALEKSVVSSTSSQAMQAFKLFKENAAARSVVAAIASDPNVWNAVLENATLKEYLESEKCKYGTEADEVESVTSSADSSGSVADSGNLADLFTDFAENVKVVVAGWVSNMSTFFHELFGDSDNKTSNEPDNWSPNSNAVRGSLFALASMVIMLVVLKRG